MHNRVEQHYAIGGLADKIAGALQGAGKDLAHLTTADLAPVDEFHVRGRQATLELAQRMELQAGARVLDIGSVWAVRRAPWPRFTHAKSRVSI